MACPSQPTQRRSLMDDKFMQPMRFHSTHNSVTHSNSVVSSDVDGKEQLNRSQEPDKRRVLLTRKSIYIGTSSMAKSCCIAGRKQLVARAKLLNDLSVATAAAGVVLMLVETELFLHGAISKSSATSLRLKTGVTFTTALLLVILLAYNITSVQITMVTNRLDKWQLAVKLSFVCRLILELLVCAVHPLPVSLPAAITQAKMDSALSLLMFLRLYLLARLLVIHSRFFTDAATCSLGAFSKVRINTLFIFKAFMSEWPGTVLLVSMVGIVILSGWSIRTCEAYIALAEDQPLNATPVANIPEAFWFSAVTFLTVGYGDVVPRSECGRVMAVVTGLLGVGLTALLVAVLANKLQLSRGEKYVYTSSVRIELIKRHKHAAADVIKNVVALWCLLQGSGIKKERTRVKSKLFDAIHTMGAARKAKMEVENAVVDLLDVHSSATDVARKIDHIEKHLVDLDTRLQTMMTRIEDLVAATQHRLN